MSMKMYYCKKCGYDIICGSEFQFNDHILYQCEKLYPEEILRNMGFQIGHLVDDKFQVIIGDQDFVQINAQRLLDFSKYFNELVDRHCNSTDEPEK